MKRDTTTIYIALNIAQPIGRIIPALACFKTWRAQTTRMVVYETPPPRLRSTRMSAATAGQSADDESIAHTQTACVGDSSISRDYSKQYGRQPCRPNRCRGCGRRGCRPYGCTIEKTRLAPTPVGVYAGDFSRTHNTTPERRHARRPSAG